MKIVHFAQFGPNKCGLYHTAKDLVKAEIGVGIDARFVDIVVDEKEVMTSTPGQKDGWLTTANRSVADDADILVRHTAMPNDLENRGIPIVMALHGRPLSSLLLDESGKGAIVEGIHNKGKDCRYKAFVTFWPEHVDFWGLILPPDKLYFVPAMVDLMEWRPDARPFHFGEFNGKPNILIADIWREDVTPFNEIMAVRDFIKNHCPEARLHIVAAPTGKGANVFFRALRDEGVLGYASDQNRLIKEMYAAADVVVSPHKIATRVMREARATGTPVIASDELMDWFMAYQGNTAHPPYKPRQWAERNYNLRNAGAAIKRVFEGILNQKPNRRKVFFDLGGHLGQTVRRFYREVEDARFYDIYTFEPHPQCYKKLCETLNGVENVKTFSDAITSATGQTRLYLGGLNDGEGSTLVAGKTTGGVDYAKSVDINGYSLQHLVEAYCRPVHPYTVLKMNIEGGEYDLMEHILDKNLVGEFNQIYIQTHSHKLDPGKRDEYKKIENRFQTACDIHKVELFMQDKEMARFQCSPD